MRKYFGTKYPIPNIKLSYDKILTRRGGARGGETQTYYSPKNSNIA